MRWRALSALAVVFFLLACLLLAIPAGAEGETPVVVTNWPTPVVYPTTVSQQGTVGLAVVPVGTAQGSQGWLMLIAAILLFGQSVIAVLLGLHLYVGRR